MLSIVLLLIIGSGLVLTIPIGRVSKARLLTSSNSTWLYQQKDANACLCNSLRLFYFNVLALNSFSSNKSCQIFISSINSPQIISDPNSTVILLQPLPTPCCSDFPWLLQQIQQAQQPSSANVAYPTFLSINSANKLLSVMSYQNASILFDRQNLTVILNTTYIGSKCAIASQNENLFIASCDNPYSVRIYNETQSGLQLRYILNVTSNPRQVVFILNDTWMLVSIQYSRVIQFYSVDLMTNTFQYNRSIAIPYDIVWSMTKRNDTLIYICFWVSAVPIYTLSYDGLVWVISNLSTIKISSSEISTQVAIDSFGRIWVAVYGFGIRIYDPNGLSLLANWSTISTGIDTLLVLDNYEIFLGDYDNKKIFHFAPDLQCTS